MKLSVIVPACNEAAALPPTLERIRIALDAAAGDFELLVVDNASDDGRRTGTGQRYGGHLP